MEKDEYAILKDQIDQAASIVIDSLFKDGKGFFNREDLKKLDLETLNLTRSKFNDVARSEYEYILEHRRQRDRDQKPKHGTIGAYNSETKQWEE
jgi:hypothetical protein